MRKRSGRPGRFVAMPNETIDDSANLDFMAMGLLNVLLRHRDGWNVTLKQIGAKYGYGEDAMAGAIGLLQVSRYVAKIRLQDSATKQWRTEIVVYDTPATDEELFAVLDDIQGERGVCAASFIEPTKKALAKAEKRAAKLAETCGKLPSRHRENPDSAPTRGNGAFSQVGADSGVSRDSANPRSKEDGSPEHETEDEGMSVARAGGPSTGSGACARETADAVEHTKTPATIAKPVLEAAAPIADLLDAMSPQQQTHTLRLLHVYVDGVGAPRTREFMADLREQYDGAEDRFGWLMASMPRSVAACCWCGANSEGVPESTTAVCSPCERDGRHVPQGRPGRRSDGR